MFELLTDPAARLQRYVGMATRNRLLFAVLHRSCIARGQGVLLPPRPSRQVRSGEIGGLALRRPIHRNFHSAQLHMIHVLAERAGRVVFQHCVQIENERVGNYIDHVNSGGCSSLDESYVRSVSESFLSSSDASRRIEHLPFSAPLHLFVFGWLRQRGIDG